MHFKIKLHERVRQGKSAEELRNIQRRRCIAESASMRLFYLDQHSAVETMIKKSKECFEVGRARCANVFGLKAIFASFGDLRFELLTTYFSALSSMV